MSCLNIINIVKGKYYSLIKDEMGNKTTTDFIVQ
jgi:hypothetical protein